MFSPEQLTRFASQVARGAGEILMERFRRLDRLEVRFKGSRQDLVTRADTDSETYVRRRITGRFPEDAIVGEEQPATAGRSQTTWYVDPLDGTTNFVHRHPFFAVSIGAWREGRVVAAVVHAPALCETWDAFEGGGARLNGRPIQVSTVADLGGSLLCTGFADIRAGMTHDNVAPFAHLVRQGQGIRRMGSAAIDLCYVAAGRLEAFWEYALGPWDVCAGSLIVEEAGGRVTDMDGGRAFIIGESVVASNGRVHDELIGTVGRFPRPRLERRS